MTPTRVQTFSPFKSSQFSVVENSKHDWNKLWYISKFVHFAARQCASCAGLYINLLPWIACV